MRYLDQVRPRRGVNSRGQKDPGVLHPPRNIVKEDPESNMVQDMYEGVGYSTKRGVIHIKTNQGSPPPRVMNEVESKAHMYLRACPSSGVSLSKGTELFGERADEATLMDLLQIDGFKTYLQATAQARIKQAGSERCVGIHDKKSPRNTQMRQVTARLRDA